MRVPTRMSSQDMDTPELEVLITAMRRRHMRSVLRIEGEVYPRPWTIGLFLSELAIRQSRAYLVARVGGGVAGYGGLMILDGDGHISTLAVDPRWQRHKVATRLLLTLTRVAIERGCGALTLEVRVGNTGAQALYRNFGFAPAGVRKGYYPETNEDAIVMWAHDIDLPEYGERLNAIEATIPGTTLVEGIS